MIRKAENKDLRTLAELACQLWPDHTVEEMEVEMGEILTQPDVAFFLAFDGATPIGFAQCQLRHDYDTVLNSLSKRVQKEILSSEK